MTTISLRFEDDIKEELDEMCESMGMNLTTFFMIYAKKVLRDRKIPFELSAPIDQFYSKKNMAQIKKASEQIAKNDVVIKNIDELETMANG